MGLTMIVVAVVVVILVVLFLDLLGVSWMLRKLWRSTRGKRARR